ncbi:SIR2 family NAD-dependent protein deacylase [Calditrichota bacterium LG25]
MEQALQRARQAVKKAQAVVIAAGAGMGVDSGLPDFRGNEGFWNNYPVARRLGLSFADLANPRWFTENPELAWAFYGHRLNLYRQTQPHEGFALLLEYGKRLPGGYFVFTSNVDGQFQKAGFDEERIVEVHGSIHHLQCVEPCTGKIWSAEGVQVEIDMESFRAKEPLPRCPYCGRLARPNILMFNDWHWLSQRTDAQESRFKNWLKEIDKKNFKLVIIEIGAGTAVPTVRITCERLAEWHHGLLIRINPRESWAPEGHVGIEGGALKTLRQLL